MMASVNSSGLFYFLILKEFSQGRTQDFWNGVQMYKGVGILFAQ